MWMIYLAAYLLALNIIAFLMYRADKRRARVGAWRFSERGLLLLAFCGGWVGAKLAQKRYRHKTRKQPFALILNAVPFVWGAIALFLIMQNDLVSGITFGLK